MAKLMLIDSCEDCNCRNESRCAITCRNVDSFFMRPSPEFPPDCPLLDYVDEIDTIHNTDNEVDLSLSEHHEVILFDSEGKPQGGADGVQSIVIIKKPNGEGQQHLPLS